MTRLVWFRTDLRIHDNPALAHARRNNDEDTLAITFVVEPQWQQHQLGERRINLMKQAIAELHASLSNIGIPLLTITKASFAECEEHLIKLMQEFTFSELNFNIEYEVNERLRDINVSRWCHDTDIAVNKFHDQCLIAPGELKTLGGDPYRVYSPFRKSWLKEMQEFCPAPCAAPEKQDETSISQNTLIHWQENTNLPKWETDDEWIADENSGHERLREFLDKDALHYHEWRDIPDLDATSSLSFYLALGLLSPRQCIYTAWQSNACALSGGEEGINTWINELIWREFYRHLLVAYPNLCKHKSFKPDYDDIKWRDAPNDFQRWCDGETGYPIVDAAMKQLKERGWMHNRLRMITAMFLTKHLLIDWRWGEDYFSKHLVDADLASNNGGWQWSASTGADGAPYFRIFNPTTQSERFDSKGYFIVQYLPKLGGLPAKSRHNPSAAERLQCKYPAPVVEHKYGRERALETFKACAG